MEIFLVALRRTETVLGKTSVGCTATSLAAIRSGDCCTVLKVPAKKYLGQEGLGLSDKDQAPLF